MTTLFRSLILAGVTAGLVAVGAPAVAPAQQKDKAKVKDTKADGGTIEMYKDKAGEYRWRVKDVDGKVIAMPPKGYDTKEDCLKALGVVKTTLAKAKVTEIKDDAEPKKDK